MKGASPAAGAEVAVAEAPQRQIPAGAALLGVQAALGEAAARLRVNGALKLADELHRCIFCRLLGMGMADSRAWE